MLRWTSRKCINTLPIIIRIGRFIFDNIFNIPLVVCSNKAISYALAICWLRCIYTEIVSQGSLYLYLSRKHYNKVDTSHPKKSNKWWGFCVSAAKIAYTLTLRSQSTYLVFCVFYLVNILLTCKKMSSKGLSKIPGSVFYINMLQHLPINSMRHTSFYFIACTLVVHNKSKHKNLSCFINHVMYILYFIFPLSFGQYTQISFCFQLRSFSAGVI